MGGGRPVKINRCSGSRGGLRTLYPDTFWQRQVDESQSDVIFGGVDEVADPIKFSTDG